MSVSRHSDISHFHKTRRTTTSSGPRPVKHLKITDEQLSDFFTQDEPLGAGHFATVYSVRDTRTNKEWAMKIVHKQALPKTRVETVEKEIVILKLLNHPHIITLNEVLESSKRIYIIIEKCHSNLDEELKKVGKFDESTVKRIIWDLGGAVEYLHRKDIVHRDIKLQNILVTTSPEDKNDNLYIKLTDFGLSVQKKGRGYRNMLHERCGTIAYMAPEIFKYRSYSQQCDIWAMGIILYVLLLGKMPFNGTTTKSITEDICCNEPSSSGIINNDEIRDLLQKMLEKDPALRFTASEVLTHPWLSGKKLDVSMSHNIVDMMREWNRESMKTEPSNLYVSDMVLDKRCPSSSEEFDITSHMERTRSQKSKLDIVK